MKINDLKNKNIAIWGLGLEGQAVFNKLKYIFNDKNIFIIEDKNYNNKQDLLNDLLKFDIIIRSPSVSIYREEILEAKKNGVIFITEKSLFLSELENSNTKIIAITGTKGKTTTSTFMSYILEKLGYKVLLSGNMGIPTINLIDEAKKSDFVILELSSYQTSDLISYPDIAIILNLFPEHLQWHLNYDNYYKDKIHLLEKSKYKIINPTNKTLNELTQKFNDLIYFNQTNNIHYKNNYFYDNNEKLFTSTNMKLLGEHNYQNICSVLTALKLLNINLKDIKQEYFDNFQPLEHRLEIIKKDDKIFVNDSISTIPEATIACYNIFKNKHIYGILGGFDRQQNYKDLSRYISENNNIKYITLLGQTSNRIANTLKENNFNNFKICNNLEECYNILYTQSYNDNNAIIILSPASPSYDMFKNFEERGNKFKELINKQK